MKEVVNAFVPVCVGRVPRSPCWPGGATLEVATQRSDPARGAHPPPRGRSSPGQRQRVQRGAGVRRRPALGLGCDRGRDVGEPGRQYAEPTSRALRRVEHADEQAYRRAAKFQHGNRRHTCRPQHVHPRLTSGDVGCRGDGSLELVLMVETSLARATTEVVPFGKVEIGRDRPGE
jgi:hypothetical protein